MTQLMNLFSNMTITDPAIWLAVGSGLVVVFLFLLLGRRKRRQAKIIGANNSDNPEVNPADAWLQPTKRVDERRKATRRLGVPTAISIVDSKKSKRPIDGFVLDRSSGGVRVAAQKPFPAGSTLQIRPANASDDSPRVIIIVRSCREVGDHFELGCQFQEELPWHVLLMFG